MTNALLYIATVLIWGTTWIAIEFQLGVVDPFVSVAYRFFIAAVIMFLICGLTGRLKQKFTVQEHGFAALLGVFLFCINYWLVYEGTMYLTSGLVALCFTTLTMMNIVHQALFFKIPVNKQVVLGTLFGLAGMVLVFYPEVEEFSFEDQTVLGIAFCLVASYSASLGNMVSVRNTRAGMPIMLTNAYGMLYGTVLALALCFVMGKEFHFDWSVSYVSSLVYLSVLGSAVAFTLYLTLVSRIGADKASYANIMYPLVALTISTFVEGYVWSLEAGFGMVLVLIGNVLAMGRVKSFAGLRKRGWRLFRN